MWNSSFDIFSKKIEQMSIIKYNSYKKNPIKYDIQENILFFKYIHILLYNKYIIIIFKKKIIFNKKNIIYLLN